MEGRLSTVISERVLNARSRSWHASLATAGCEAREKAQGPMRHPEVTGKGKTGRVNKREPPQASLPRTSADGGGTEEQGSPLGDGSGSQSFDAGYVSTTAPGYRRHPTPAETQQCGTWKPCQGPVEQTKPPVNRPQGRQISMAGQDGQEANGGMSKDDRKAGTE